MQRTFTRSTLWYTSLLLVLGVSISTHFTHAESTEEAATPRVRALQAIEARHERVDTARAEFEARAAELRTTASSTRQATRSARVSAAGEARIAAVITATQDRINTAVARLGDISTRIEIRATELSDRGVRTAEAIAFIDIARVELRAASSVINEELQAEVAAALSSEDPRTAFTYVKESMHEAVRHLHSAQSALRDAVSALKDAVKNAANDSSDSATE